MLWRVLQAIVLVCLVTIASNGGPVSTSDHSVTANSYGPDLILRENADYRRGNSLSPAEWECYERLASIYLLLTGTTAAVTIASNVALCCSSRPRRRARPTRAAMKLHGIPLGPRGA